LSVAIGFPLGVWGGLLEGLEKFYLLNLISVGSTLLRCGLIVIALNHGSGLLMLAFITVMLPLAASIVRMAVSLHFLPLGFGFRHVDRNAFRRMANYGGVTFMIIVAGRLRFKTDAIIIGTFLSSAAITQFAIGSRIIDYATELVSSLAQIFVPMSSHSDATGDMMRLRKIFVAGNRACALVILPISAV